MKTFIPAVAIAASLAFGGAAFAQASGGPDAKGNAPLKAAHTVNDGTAKRGANSFTEAQAKQHIEKSGFTGVSNLAKGDDGVWRGQAMRDGQTMEVAMDFKGNVSTGGGATATRTTASSSTTETAAGRTTGDAAAMSGAGATETTTTQTTAMAHHRRRHHRHHVACANPSPNGAACSGVDRNQNGISDKEDRAIKAGAHP